MDTDADAGQAPPPPTNNRPTLQPGGLSKPEKVWTSATTLVIGFYQAAPFSDAFKIFYKKSGAVFGTQVMLTPASILGPELAVRQPVSGEVQYFEYEIKKLKPSTQYVIKVKTSDDACEVRSEKMGTVSQEEERRRDNDMNNFVGALVKLGDYDGLVVSYTPQSGIFAIRILQIDDVAASLQLARLTSDYTDNGVPVQAYTLSQVRFGRWGGAITGSKVVNEGELKWLVARAVQMTDKSDAAAAFEARHKMLQSQVERVTVGLELEWSSRFRSLRIRSAAYLLLLALFTVAAGVGMFVSLRQSGWQQRDLRAQLAERSQRQAELEAELQMLHLYRVSLELDVARRVALADGLAAQPDLAAAGNCSSLTPEACVAGAGVRHVSNQTRAALVAAFGLHQQPSGNEPAAAAAADAGAAAGGGGADEVGKAPDGAQQRRRGGSGNGGGDGASKGAGRPLSTAKRRREVTTPAGAQQRRGVEAGSTKSKAASAKGGPVPTQRRAGFPLDRSPPAKASARRGAGGSSPAAAARRSTTRPGATRPGRSTGDGHGGDGQPENDARGGRRGSGGREDSYGEDGGGDAVGLGGAQQGLWGLPHRALLQALARSRTQGGSSALRQEWVAEAEAYGEAAEMDEQPDAWAFIHYVSHVYAMYLQEWMKVQLQKNVRHTVNEMLLTSPPDSPTRRNGAGTHGDGGTGGGSGGSRSDDRGGDDALGVCGPDEYGEHCDPAYRHTADYDEEYDDY